MMNLAVFVPVVSLGIAALAQSTDSSGGSAVTLRGEQTQVQTVQPPVTMQPDDVLATLGPALPETIGDLSGGLPIPDERLQWHVPDPAVAVVELRQQLAGAERRSERRYYEQTLKRIEAITRPTKLTFSLEDVLREAMLHNFAVRVASYNPAIETAQVVEAEARFDANFFYRFSRDKQNVPVASSLVGSNTEDLVMSGGVSKLLASGMQATTSLNLQRQLSDSSFQELNPAWGSSFVVELRQPFLRGFGLDYNRSFITVARLDQRISEHAFRRSVIETLVEIERAYWTLVQARREVVISARVLSRFEQIYEYLEQRKEFDAYKIQIADTRARLEQNKAAYIQVLANLRNAEDQLVGLVNSPKIDLADNIELIPADFPSQSPVVLDRLSEVQAALDHRPELYEAQLRVKRARVAVGQAKNQALPQFDLTFRYTVDGLADSAHDAFSEVTKNDFHEYYVAIELQWPIGNRAGRSRITQARLAHSQAIAALRQQFEAVILDVNVQVRTVTAAHLQIRPSFETVEASEDQYEALVARAESKNFLQLNQELNAVQSLASSRRTLLDALVEYNLAIIELERAKGSLPEHNNILLLSAAE